MLLCEAIHKNLEHADTVGDDIARGMQKNVSEYEKLTRYLPGLWRTTREEKEKAETATRKDGGNGGRKAKVNNGKNEKSFLNLKKQEL